MTVLLQNIAKTAANFNVFIARILPKRCLVTPFIQLRVLARCSKLQPLAPRETPFGSCRPNLLFASIKVRASEPLAATWCRNGLNTLPIPIAPDLIQHRRTSKSNARTRFDKPNRTSS
ncbi:MAG: hypothetical protein GY778_19470 [bacterium]|nr:hypothetical protein [bacterium]